MRFFITLSVVLGLILLLLFYLTERHDEARRAQPTPAPAPTPTPTLPLAQASMPQPVYTPAPILPAYVNPTAQRHRVGLSGVRRDNDWVVFTVRGYDRNHLYDFLDDLQRQGMRDIDLNRKYRQFMSQGRVIHEDVFRVRF